MNTLKQGDKVIVINKSVHNDEWTYMKTIRETKEISPVIDNIQSVDVVCEFKTGQRFAFTRADIIPYSENEEAYHRMKAGLNG
jgi:hypothetical protein